MNKKFKIIVYKGEDNYYVAECVELPGCISQGKTKAEAYSNIKEAIELYLETLKEHAQEPPKVEMSEVEVAA